MRDEASAALKVAIGEKANDLRAFISACDLVLHKVDRRGRLDSHYSFLVIKEYGQLKAKHPDLRLGEGSSS